MSRRDDNDVVRSTVQYVWIAGLLAALLAGGSTAAAPPSVDLPGWRAARWGMTDADLETAFGPTLATLPGRWVFGRAYAVRAVLGETIGGERFNAYFEMGARTDRLEQVLLERRGRGRLGAAFAAVRQALEAEHGPPHAVCTARQPGGAARVDLVWRFPTTTIHAAFVNLQGSALEYADPNRDPDPIRPNPDRRALSPRALARKLLIRYHPTARADLMGNRGCEARDRVRPPLRGAPP